MPAVEPATRPIATGRCAGRAVGRIGPALLAPPIPAPTIRRAMKKLLNLVVPAVLTLFAACSSTVTAAPAPTLLKSNCLVSGEPLKADSPTADYAGGKVGFCCSKCLGKWNGMDDAGKKAKFDAAK
jgi:hypothetical protein